MADLQCQFPIVKWVATRCANKARWHDYYGWTFCDEHKTDGDRLLGSERPIKDAPDLGQAVDNPSNESNHSQVTLAVMPPRGVSCERKRRTDLHTG